MEVFWKRYARSGFWQVKVSRRAEGANGLASLSFRVHTLRFMPQTLPLSNRNAAWGALAILSGLNLFNYLDRYVMAAVVTPMQKDLSLPDNDAGWVASAFMLGYFITAATVCRENT